MQIYAITIIISIWESSGQLVRKPPLNTTWQIIHAADATSSVSSFLTHKCLQLFSLGCTKTQGLGLCCELKRNGATLCPYQGNTPPSALHCSTHADMAATLSMWWQMANTSYRAKKVREYRPKFGSPHIWECVFIRGSGMEAWLSSKLSAHGNVTKDKLNVGFLITFGWLGLVTMSVWQTP